MIMKIIDLRSDTVTQPTPAMMEAIAQAKLGDDVWGDDPTVIQLQEIAAEKLGTEDSLFVPSGTMGNLIAALVHCQRSDELILGDKSHIFRWEVGNLSAVGGIHPHLLSNRPDGTLALEDIEAAIRPENVHFPDSRAIFLENTHNNCGGVAIPPEYFAAVREIANRHGLIVHLDGARLFNAAVALNCSAQEFTRHADTVMICLSKGLCAPIGSILAGSKEFIHRARRVRKMLGGGMRQVGILAAAGNVALEQMVNRLADDHANAETLSNGLHQLPGLKVPGMEIAPDATLTNMVFFELEPEFPLEPHILVEQLDREYHIKIELMAGRQFRLVTHYWVSSDDVEQTLAAFRAILNAR
jgi:threonine aldolase